MYTCGIHTHIQTQIYRRINTDTHTYTNRQTDRQTQYTHIHTHTHTHTHTQIDRHTRMHTHMIHYIHTIHIHTIPVTLFGGVLRTSGDCCSEALEQGKSTSLTVAVVTLLEDGELALGKLFFSGTDTELFPSSSSSLSSSIFLFRDFLLAMGEVSCTVAVFSLLSPLDLYRVYMKFYTLKKYAVHVFLYCTYRNRCYFHGINISRIPYVSNIRDFIFTNPYRGKAV